MTIELAELAAGLPFAASFALAGGITALREGKRRTVLNEAMHELRRPLQVLSLLADRDGGEAVASSLELTAAALERLDREINREVATAPADPVRIRPLVEGALARWRPQAQRQGRILRLWRGTGEGVVLGRRFDLSQALDNLINNALEHGAGEVRIEVRNQGKFTEIVVSDSDVDGTERGKSGSRSSPRREGEAESRAPGRRGHGLRLVRRIARQHGGRFSFHTGAGGSAARLVLPLLGSEAAR